MAIAVVGGGYRDSGLTAYRRVHRFAGSLLLVMLLVAPWQTLARDYSRYESGKIWCNERYLFPEDGVFDQLHLDVARRGYLYVLAAALEQQRDGEQDHFFAAPDRLRRVDRVGPDDSGFEAATFELRSTNAQGSLETVIVAFAGSNQPKDWIKTNFGWDNRQYTSAREYLEATARKYPGIRLVTSGFSLGGSLAVHVAKHPVTKPLVAEVWALNPGPRIKVSRSKDERIWLAAMRKDVIKWARDLAGGKGSGKGAIGAYPEHAAEKYYLVHSMHTYAHFRWVLARNILFAADLALQDPAAPSASTEPLEILKLSRFKACDDPPVDLSAAD